MVLPEPLLFLILANLSSSLAHIASDALSLLNTLVGFNAVLPYALFFCFNKLLMFFISSSSLTAKSLTSADSLPFLSVSQYRSLCVPVMDPFQVLFF